MGATLIFTKIKGGLGNLPSLIVFVWINNLKLFKVFYFLKNYDLVKCSL